MGTQAATLLEHFVIPSFKFAGGTVKDVKIAYRSFNPGAAKGTVLIPTCFQGRVNKTRNFTNGALKDYNVIVAAMLGNGESSSPSNDFDFPTDYSLRYEDCINSQHALLTQHLGVRSLEAVIGFSMGGQQAYHWAVMHGTGPKPFVKRAVVICGSAKTSGLNYAFLEGPTAALLASRDYDHGRYKNNGVKPTEGLRAFGRVYEAWVPSAEWFRQELWRGSGAQSVHEYMNPPIGKSGYEEWDPEDLLTMVRMWQAGDVGIVAGGVDYKQALANVTARVLVMPSETDQYFSVEDGKNEVDHLRHGIFRPIPSIWGHMAGAGADPADAKWLDERISEFLGDDDRVTKSEL